jgi:two-component system response regulator FixJ
MPEPSTARPLVVVVDDDPSIRKALARLLRSASLEVEVFGSAGDLLARNGSLRPACLVIDVHLPDMNGISLLRQLVAAEPGRPVVMITGDRDPELRLRALQEGAAAVLVKPFDEDQLLDEVRRALANR